MDHTQHTQRTRVRVPQPNGCPGDLALPDRLRYRGSPGHGYRHCPGLGNAASITLSVVLAFLFGYALTFGPILRAGVPFRRAAGLTFASDTASITTMEIVDNAFILIVPGAMAAGLSDSLFWWSLIVSLIIAFIVTVPVNRWLLARGRGHAVVHQFH